MNKILEVLKKANKPMNIREIASMTGWEDPVVLMIINRTPSTIIEMVHGPAYKLGRKASV